MVLPMEEIGLERFSVEGEAAELEVDGETLDFLVTGTVGVPGLIGTLQTSNVPPNQRRLYRLRHELRMEITADGENWYTAVVKNVSEGGLLAIDPGVPDIAPCRLITAHLLLPEHGPIIINGVIARIETPWPGTYDRRHRLVVEFKEISKDDARALVRFIYRCQIDAAAYR